MFKHPIKFCKFLIKIYKISMFKIIAEMETGVRCSDSGGDLADCTADTAGTGDTAKGYTGEV